MQNYYDKGMEVPDDVTLLLCDDNWGNVRKLPDLTEKPRKGGYGMYYHFDYVVHHETRSGLTSVPSQEYGNKCIWHTNMAYVSYGLSM